MAFSSSEKSHGETGGSRKQEEAGGGMRGRLDMIGGRDASICLAGCRVDRQIARAPRRAPSGFIRSNRLLLLCSCPAPALLLLEPRQPDPRRARWTHLWARHCQIWNHPKTPQDTPRRHASILAEAALLVWVTREHLIPSNPLSHRHRTVAPCFPRHATAPVPIPPIRSIVFRAREESSVRNFPIAVSCHCHIHHPLSCLSRSLTRAPVLLALVYRTGTGLFSNDLL
ncbi:hypothetical protein EV356DRAFT_354693 [Viridothelium virens]|uniref:Uncharacterized protein n=1 Tax=Viridothelium virens TaxID=1048519 RepID=A0A6A6GW97_VIRVR|nr:hypothetical protein EV356DRAFT_354693 [Viridothelium virens]